ncbi:3-dehydroquinate synthase family protein [Candidatus Vidania fulgoroideorum]
MKINNILFIKRNHSLINFINKIKNKYFIVDFNLYKKNLFLKKIIKKNFFFIKKSEYDKNIKSVNKIVLDLLNNNFHKDCNLICIGGGVVGDLGGFISSVYFRGINYVNIPTTLLSMVDSSIGGKNGINIKRNKNILGTIYFPKLIIIFENFLKTLKKSTFLEGFSEIIKISIINNKNLFNELNKFLFNKNLKTIFYSILSKIKIIKKDIYDKNIRFLLNLGHTFAHSIEKVTKNKVNHGNAVFLGILISSYISYKLFFLKKKFFFNIIYLLKKYNNLKKNLFELNYYEIYNNLKYDKKNFLKYLKLVLISENGCFLKKTNLLFLKVFFCKKNISELVNLV